MSMPVRSFSYGPDSTQTSSMSARKRKRGPDAEGSLRYSPWSTHTPVYLLINLSCHLTCLSGDHTQSSQPTVQTPALSDASSTFSEPPQDEALPASSPQAQSAPFVFNSPRKSRTSLLHRPIAQPHPNKRAHTMFTSSPVIPSTPALTFSSDSFSQVVNQTPATACHLCYRKPRSVQELPSFTDCDTCHQRTCNVCIRVCEGPRCKPTISARQTFFSGATPLTADLERQGKVVCRTCCVEVGVEGRVWCESCYADDTEVESYSLGKNKKELAVENLGRIASWLEDCGGLGEITAEPENEDMAMEDWS